MYTLYFYLTPQCLLVYLICHMEQMTSFAVQSYLVFILSGLGVQVWLGAVLNQGLRKDTFFLKKVLVFVLFLCKQTESFHWHVSRLYLLRIQKYVQATNTNTVILVCRTPTYPPILHLTQKFKAFSRNKKNGPKPDLDIFSFNHIWFYTFCMVLCR